jgi:hypothetical protein
VFFIAHHEVGRSWWRSPSALAATKAIESAPSQQNAEDKQAASIGKCADALILVHESGSWAQPCWLALEFDGRRRKRVLVEIIGE